MRAVERRGRIDGTRTNGQVTRRDARSRRCLQLPTLGVAFAIYAGFSCLTWWLHSLTVLTAPLCSVLLAWYGSLQHETIHGHPTRWRRFNDLLACAPLSLWMPYTRYRETHLAHHAHQGRYLTEVPGDPESFYLPQGALSSFGRLRRALHVANCTLLGRLVLGPAIAILTFWAGEARSIRAGDRRTLLIWLRHIAGVTAVLWWIVGVCHIPVGTYVMLIVYPSIAITHVRSYVEHRAETDPSLRTRVVESNPLCALLFLNNNLHVAHHAHPQLPWYRLPAAWRHMRATVEGRGLIYAGYREVLRRYLFQAYITVEHPLSAGERPS